MMMGQRGQELEYMVRLCGRAVVRPSRRRAGQGRRAEEEGR